MSDNKLRVAVLYGGKSFEHEISLRSAFNVVSNLDKNLFEVVPIGIDQQGNWYLGEETFRNSLEHKQVKQLTQKNDPWFSATWVGNANHALDNNNIRKIDVVFPVVHGPSCEDGSLQGLLELADLPYVGSRVMSSAISMDKDIAKRLAQLAGVNVAPYIVIKKDSWASDELGILEHISSELNFPLFVKPANTGSSVGINKVKNSSELKKAIEIAFKYDRKILVEKALDIIEIEVAVLESLNNSNEPIIGSIGQVKPTHEFYSYEAKYLDENGAELIIPAKLSDDIKNKIHSLAKKIFLALECEGMARIDLFIEKSTNNIYFNELNTLPGFTEISMYPMLMQAAGVSYSNLLTHLIELALKNYKQKKQLITHYET